MNRDLLGCFFAIQVHHSKFEIRIELKELSLSLVQACKRCGHVFVCTVCKYVSVSYSV